MNQAHPMTLDDVLAFSPLNAWRAGATDPDPSPDGRQVLHCHEGHVWLVSTDAGEPQPVTEGVSPRWSPSGEVIAFLRGQPAQLWITDMQGKERRLTDLASGITL